jgi:hypothetical protein
MKCNGTGCIVFWYDIFGTVIWQDGFGWYTFAIFGDTLAIAIDRVKEMRLLSQYFGILWNVGLLDYRF